MAVRKSATPKTAKPKDGASQTPPPAPRFAKWIEDVGPKAIAESLGIGFDAVYKWKYGALGKNKGTRPDPSLLAGILRLAAGELSAADIYPPPREDK